MRMFRVTVQIIIAATILGQYSISDAQETDDEQDAFIPQLIMDDDINVKINDRADAENNVKIQIEQLESLMGLSNTPMIKGTVPNPNIKKVFADMTKLMSDIKEEIKNKTYAQVFIDYDGLNRVVFPNLKKPSKALRSGAISLLNSIFDIVPKEIKNFSIRESVTLLNFLKSEKSVSNKAIVIDIFSKWLPENPILQKEVLDNNGMEAFYGILPTIGTQLKVITVNILDSLITEHLTTEDEVHEIYNEVGLLDALKKHDTCEGLFILFEDLFTSAPDDTSAIDSMTSLMEKVLPFCKHFYKNDSKMDVFLKDMEKYYAREHSSADGLVAVGGGDRVLKVIEKYKEELGPAIVNKDEL